MKPEGLFQVAFKLSLIHPAAHAAGYRVALRVSAGTGFQGESQFERNLELEQRPSSSQSEQFRQLV